MRIVTTPRPRNQSWDNLGSPFWKMLGWVFLYLWPVWIHAGPWIADTWIITLTIFLTAVRRLNHRPARPTTDLRKAANDSGRYPPTPPAAGTPHHQP